MGELQLEDVALAADASRAARRAVEVIARGIRQGSVSTPFGSAEAQCWMSLNYFRPLSPEQLATLLAEQETWHREGASLAARMKKFSSKRLPANHFDSDYLIAGPPSGAPDRRQLLLPVDDN